MEVLLKALAVPAVHAAAASITVVADMQLLVAAHSQLAPLCSEPLARPADLDVRHVAAPVGVGVGVESAAGGEAAWRCLEAAITATLAGEFDAIVTGPISKAAWALAGHVHPGQTEVLARRSGTARYGMMFVAESPHTGWQLRTLLATTHVPLSEVPRLVTPELLDWKLDLLLDTLTSDFGVRQPQVALAGLNPHAGEGGLLGSEEAAWLTPWAAARRTAQPCVALDGPLPPDSMFLPAGRAWWGGGDCTAPDAFLALYHDQGLIPVKLLAFDSAVNITAGLPFVRTSPDHGTALGIAGRGVADASSMRAAVRLAAQLAQGRRRRGAGSSHA